MTEERRPDDPFFDPDDPAAVERERRRLEREERRRKREQKRAERQPAERQPPEPPRAERPPAEPSRTERQPPEPSRTERPVEQGRADTEPAGEEPYRPAARGGTPLADRITAMRRRASQALAERARQPRAPRSARAGDLVTSLFENRRRLLALLGGLVVLWFLIALFQPFHGDPGDPVVVQIPEGASAGEVGDILDDDGVVSSGTLFEVRATLAGKRSELYPGTYTLAQGMSYGDAIDALTIPPEKRTITITIPEGLSRLQIAPIANQAGIKGRYMKATKRSRYLNPARYGAQGRARNLEGFLFPSTYELPARGTAANLVQLQLRAFKQRIRGVDMRYARSKNLTTYDVLIIASMIEREVMVPRERRLVAAVIYNRLRDGMPLGIDATIRFAVGNYTKPLTNSQLQTPSAYNTRLNAGLPPGPIGNPGLAAIDAAAHPAKVDYLFYVVKPGTCGEHNFSSNEAKFQRDAAAYQRALEAKGGSPTTC